MGLEAGNHLNDLNEANPVGPLDARSEGDEHFRLLKKTLKNTFPGMAGRAWRTIARAASGALTVTDNMTLQSGSAGITLTANAASVLGNGWLTLVRAPSTGSVTLAAAEKINGSDANYTVPAGHMAILTTNGTEFFAVVMYESTPATPPVFPAGTKMVFHQTVAPTGWTKLTNSQYNDAALRMTTGTVASGGADNFTTTFGAGKATAGHTLTVSQIPSHSHSIPIAVFVEIDDLQNPSNSVRPGSSSTGSTGGGGSHAHNLNDMNIKYVDIIVAEKT